MLELVFTVKYCEFHQLLIFIVSCMSMCTGIDYLTKLVFVAGDKGNSGSPGVDGSDGKSL